MSAEILTFLDPAKKLRFPNDVENAAFLVVQSLNGCRQVPVCNLFCSRPNTMIVFRDKQPWSNFGQNHQNYRHIDDIP